MVELKDILDAEEIILIDSSIKRGHGFAWEVYETGKYSQVDIKMLKKAILDTKVFEELLYYPNVYTINGVVKEIKGFEKVVNAKVKDLDYKRKFRAYSKSLKQKISKREEEVKTLFNELQQRAYSARKLAEQKKINRFPKFANVNDPVYESLLNMTKLLSRKLKLKTDTGHVMGFREKDRSEDSDTDEKLVSTLYRINMMGECASIASKDYDIQVLLGVVTRVIGSDSFLPYNEKFRKRNIESPFVLYFYNIGAEMYETRIDSSEIRYDGGFRLGGVDRGQELRIKEKITKSWKNIYSYLAKGG